MDIKDSEIKKVSEGLKGLGSKMMEFEDINPAQVRATFNKMKRNVRTGRKVGGAAHDIYEAGKGVRSNKRRKRFWQKQAFKDSVTAAGLLSLIGGAAAMSRSKIFLGNLKKYRDFINRVGTSYLERLDDRIELDVMKALGIEDEKKGWRTSRPTGQSVRVHIGKKKRDRRDKKWHEKTEWKNRFIAAGGATTIAASILGLAGLRGNLSKINRLKGAVEKTKKYRSHVAGERTRERAATQRAVADKTAAEQRHTRIEKVRTWQKGKLKRKLKRPGVSAANERRATEVAKQRRRDAAAKKKQEADSGTKKRA